MSKVTRKRLARGSDLTPDHVFGPVGSAAASGATFQVNAANIEPSQLQTPRSPFRVNIHIPYIASDIQLDPNQATFGVPFTLPPLQEYFGVNTSAAVSGSLRTPSITDSTPRIVLNEVSFSFGTRSENCAIADQFYGEAALSRTGESVDRGKMTFAGASDLRFRLSMREKTPMFFTEPEFPMAHDPESVMVEKEIFGTDIGNLSYTGRFLRNNPLVVTDINKSISPYSTYMLILDAKNIVSPETADNTLCLPSVNISMKFSHPLVPRDAGADIQNLPSDSTPNNRGTKKSRNLEAKDITITAPSAGDIISADGSGGVSNELASLDKVFKDGLKGGYDREGMPPALEELQSDSGYEVIAVPLFNNRINGGILENTACLQDEPYTPVDTGNYPETWDNRIVPISFPMTVHHVVLAWNWTNFYPSDNTTVLPGPSDQRTPDTATFTVEVGVAAGTMLRSASWAYNQIAHLRMVQPSSYQNTTVPAATWSQGSIDRVKFRYASLLRKGGSGAWNQNGKNAWDWELHQVPIVGAASPDGAGYYPQGKPYYLGSNWSLNASRNQVYDASNNLGPPADSGNERFIEVRMKISDTAGLNNLATNSLISGYGGHFVYIIGKKHLT